MNKCKFESCNRVSKCKGYCDKHYRRILKRGDVNDHGCRKVDDGNAIERFYKKYEINDSGCWIWTGGTRPNNKGVKYPRHWNDDKKSVGAHRFSYSVFIGEIPKGMYVCHKCDVPLCVNPDHLFIGTHEENMKDMTEKGRSFKGCGDQKKGLSKLTNSQANEILALKMPQSKIAKIYNVSQTTISRIKRGVSYYGT